MKKTSKRIIAAMMTAICAVSTIGAASVSAISMNTAINTCSTSETICKSQMYYGTWTTLEKRKFPNNYYWAGGNPDAAVASFTASTPDNDWGVDDLVGPKYTHYAMNCWMDEQEGFAFKLAFDFYHTKSFMQINNSAAYEPRVGDIVCIGNDIVFLNDKGKSEFSYVKCFNGTKKIIWSSMSKTAVKNQALYAWRPMTQGDINGDTLITAEDANMLQSYIMKANIDSNVNNPFWKAAADVDNDGGVDLSDLLKLNLELTENFKNNLYYLTRANG